MRGGWMGVEMVRGVCRVTPRGRKVWLTLEGRVCMQGVFFRRPGERGRESRAGLAGLTPFAT